MEEYFMIFGYSRDRTLVNISPYGEDLVEIKNDGHFDSEQEALNAIKDAASFLIEGFRLPTPHRRPQDPPLSQLEQSGNASREILAQLGFSLTVMKFYKFNG